MGPTRREEEALELVCPLPDFINQLDLKMALKPPSQAAS
jgi:hypothetical protein